jgi:hypothetical protein
MKEKTMASQGRKLVLNIPNQSAKVKFKPKILSARKDSLPQFKKLRSKNEYNEFGEGEDGSVRMRKR